MAMQRYKVTRGKWEVGVNRRNGKTCYKMLLSTTDWPHLVASSTYNDAMQMRPISGRKQHL